MLRKHHGKGRMQELMQYKDRDRWYLPTFAADDAPDWNQGRFVRSRQLAPGIREVRHFVKGAHQ